MVSKDVPYFSHYPQEPSLKDKGVLYSEDRQNAEILNNQFHSVSTTENLESIPTSLQDKVPHVQDIGIHTPGIEKLLKDLNPNKAAGVDDISLPQILKELSHELAPILSVIFQASLDSGQLPEDWRNANVSPIYIKGDRMRAENYRLVSFTSVCYKVLEHVVHSHECNFNLF